MLEKFLFKIFVEEFMQFSYIECEQCVHNVYQIAIATE